jgi:hypothetical protein
MRNIAMKTAIPSGSIAAMLVLGGCAVPSMNEVPASLQPGSAESLAMVVPARGVQIYECRARKDGAGHEWAFVAPDAELFDSHGRRIGTHFAGPSWEANDGSRVKATLKARADAPNAGAIPWLLLEAKSEGRDGSFSRVTSIQRVNTAGGIAPANGCGPDTLGKSMRVPYTADYFFFARG